MITQYEACAPWGPAPSCAASLPSAISLVWGFVLGFGFFCKPPHATPKVHNPTEIRAISLWKEKILLIPEHRAQT